MKSLFKWLKIGDYAIIVALGLLTLASQLIIQHRYKEGETVRISVDGEEKLTSSLVKDSIIPIKGYLGISTIHIHAGSAWIEDSPCPNKHCIHMGKIHRAGEMIICIPNRVILLVEGKPESGVDAVTM